MIIAGTGHRPNKLGGYSNAITDKLADIARESLKEYNTSKVITGMALGWDTALAIASLKLNIPYIAAVPFRGQDYKWSYDARKLYEFLLNKASEVKIISEGSYDPKQMQIRNEWMVDNCDLLLCLWNGNNSGGTYNCIQYAKRVLNEGQIVNVWNKFK